MGTSRITGRAAVGWLLVIFLLAAALGLWLGARVFAPAAKPTLQSAVLYPEPRTPAPFELSRSDGGTLVPADFQGHWSVLFFGYTHCPDICPTTLATLGEAWQLLGTDGLQERLRVIFISVDPGRDSPAELGRYVGHFSPDFLAATGSDEQLQRLGGSLGVMYARHDAGGDSGYAVDHSAALFLIDPAGRAVGAVPPPISAGALAADLRSIVTTH